MFSLQYTPSRIVCLLSSLSSHSWKLGVGCRASSTAVLKSLVTRTDPFNGHRNYLWAYRFNGYQYTVMGLVNEDAESDAFRVSMTNSSLWTYAPSLTVTVVQMYMCTLCMAWDCGQSYYDDSHVHAHILHILHRCAYLFRLAPQCVNKHQFRVHPSARSSLCPAPNGHGSLKRSSLIDYSTY